MVKKTRRERSDLVSVLRQAVREATASGMSGRAIARAAGLDATQLNRFMRGERTLTLPVAAVLAEYLGLELVPRRKKGG